MDQTDIKILRASAITDTDQNGGRADMASIVVSGVKFNLFPRVTSTEREQGVTRYRKAFMANMNTGGETAYGACAGLGSVNAGQDRFYIAKGTHADTQADISGYSWTGCGRLGADVTAGDESLQIVFKSADYAIAAENLLMVTDGTETTYIRAQSVSWNANTVTVILQSQLPYSFASADTVVSVMLEAGDLIPSADGFVKITVSGAFDESKLLLYNAGTEPDTFSVTFTSAFSFAAAGVNAGALPSGSVSSAYSPVNSKTGRPYFTIPAESWSGIFEAGNSISFNTYPASQGLWIKEVVPAGCAHEPDNKTSIAWLID